MGVELFPHEYAERPKAMEFRRRQCGSRPEMADKELAIVTVNPYYFWTGYVLTEDENDRYEPVKKAPVRDYIQKIMLEYLTQTHLAVPKSRQMMFTWLFCALAVWEARFYRGRKILIQVGDKSEDAADAIIRRCYFIDTHLPEFLRRHPLNSSVKGEHLRGRMEYEVGGSSIRGLPAGPTLAAAKHFRQWTGSRVIIDEGQTQENLEEVLTAANPMLPKRPFSEGGGVIVVVGTAQGGTGFERLVAA